MTEGVPTFASTVAVGVPKPAAVPVAPVSPLSPFAPCAPVSPLSPFAPLRFLKAKLNTFAVLPPEAVTVTEGVPTFASTVAVGVPKPAAVPVAPVSPLSPFGIVRLRVVTVPLVEAEAEALLPAAPVVTVPILILVKAPTSAAVCV